MRHSIRLLLFLLLIFACALQPVWPVLAQDGGQGGEEAFIAGLLPKLSPEAKIGQLFVVAFDGTDTSNTSAIADLVRNYEVGGVVLSAERGNIGVGSDTPLRVAGLTSRLQNLARTPGTAPFVPLFVALQQDGDGSPDSEILVGLTPAPAYMALGATWTPAQAEAMGHVVGQELSAIGVNLLLGPTLDVRTQPSTSIFDPGVGVFGGDPYWVGVLGESYTRGLQAGSAGHLASTGKHFPGQGNLNDDSFTIDRSLSDLAKIDLPPFERVMLSPAGKGRPLADVLLTTNARYRGFGGNIRERTAPISLDGDSLQTLLDLPAVKDWRDNGGLLMSDAPGSVTVRDYYSVTNSGTFSITRAALDAFQAGNDLLILDNLPPREEAAQIREVIDAFRQKYSTDPAFQQRVDSAVQRILRLKYRLYPDYAFSQVAVPLNQVSGQINKGGPVAQAIAQEAVTLLAPLPDQLATQRPEPTDTFLLAVDTRPRKECPTCLAAPTLDPIDLAQSLTRQYGVPTENITTTTYSELKAFLTKQAGAPDLTPTFDTVKWIILAQQAIHPASGDSDAGLLLLDQHADLLAGKRVIGLLFGPPQGLTAQQLARATAWYSLYGKLTPNIEAAVQALAGENVPPGRSPVSLPMLNYDLTHQTEPDPAQTIPVMVSDITVPGQQTPAPVTLRVGETAQLRAGAILDHNGHPVPDGTPVKFYFQYEDAAVPTVQEAKTLDGIARTDFVLSKEGRLLIRATSEPALTSTLLQMTISKSGAVVATIAPTPTPTVTPIPTSTRTPTATPTQTATPVPGAMEVFFTYKPKHAQWGELALALLGAVLLSSSAYWVVRRRQRRVDLGRALRAALWTATGCLLGYVYFRLGWPGSEGLRAALSGWAALAMTVGGGLIPLLYWLSRRPEPYL